MEEKSEKHFQDGSVGPQIPPLRYAPVGMTKDGVTLPFDTANENFPLIHKPTSTENATPSFVIPTGA
jgi:hypothetical protein